MKLIAHRARVNDDAENSVLSLPNALRYTHGVEIDIRLSADGVPVLMHDATTDRTTSSTGRVESMTAGALAKVLLGEDDFVPTLAHYLSRCSELDAPMVMLDIQNEDEATLSAIADVVLASRVVDSCLMSVRNEPAVIALRSLGYEGQICMLTTRADNIERRVELAGSTGLDLLLISYLPEIPDHRSYPLSVAKRAGIPTAAGVLADPEAIEEASRDGIDYGLVDLVVS